ncbi:MAG: hypothetical protein GWP06_05705 [Actinobacteria bacterium]|nr:hypothetical protein [Actinomycetota bacterium]
MKKLLLSFILVLIYLAQIQCERKPTAPEIIISTTIGKGPGGPAVLYGQIKSNYEPVTNVGLYVFSNRDYSDTLVHIFINSSDASFQITDLPLDTVDIIILERVTYQPRKENDYVLTNGNNHFQVDFLNFGRTKSPKGWFEVGIRYFVDIAKVEKLSKLVNCNLDTVPSFILPPVNKYHGTKYYKLTPQDNQSLLEKFNILILKQPVLGFSIPGGIAVP